MKKFLIFIVLATALMIWLQDWSSSGRMDAYIDAHADPKITPNLLFFIGESYYTANDSKSASNYLRRLVEQYPDYPYAARARFHLGQSYEDNNERGRAMEQYIILKDSYTATVYGKDAMKKWEKTKF